MISFFKTIVYIPLFNALVFIYNAMPWKDLGIAIILLTIFVRVILYPLNKKSLISQKKMQKLQPKIKEIQVKYKDNKEEMTKNLMSFYSENKINPITGCLPLLIQFPIIISLFEIFLHIFETDRINLLYSFVKNPTTLNPMFLGVVNLTQISIPLAIMAAIVQYYQAKIMIPKESMEGKDTAAMISRMTVYGMPIITLFFGFKFAATLPLFWLVLTAGIYVEHKLIEKELKKEEALKVKVIE